MRSDMQTQYACAFICIRTCMHMHVTCSCCLNASLLRTRSILPMTSDNFIGCTYMHKISKYICTYVSMCIILQSPVGNIQ